MKVMMASYAREEENGRLENKSRTTDKKKRKKRKKTDRSGTGKVVYLASSDKYLVIELYPEMEDKGRVYVERQTLREYGLNIARFNIGDIIECIYETKMRTNTDAGYCKWKAVKIKSHVFTGDAGRTRVRSGVGTVVYRDKDDQFLVIELIHGERDEGNVVICQSLIASYGHSVSEFQSGDRIRCVYRPSDACGWEAIKIESLGFRRKTPELI